jgi:tetratricopeptide (TPR) repeat protein
LAESLLKNAPNNRYNRQAAAWVHLECLKKEATQLEKALPYLESICALGFDASEKILWEQIYWQVAKVLFKTTALLDSSILGRFFNCWKSFAVLPGQAYSVLLKSLLKHAATLPNLPDWVEYWGWEHLQGADFETETLTNGKKMPALAERVYLAVAKAYLSQTSTDNIPFFLCRLDAISETHPEMLYLIYYRALLRLKIGNPAEALQFFVPFAQKKHRDFWVWDLLAQLHSHDMGIQMACMAKALTCKTPPEFLVKIRYKMAALLVAEGRWQEARTEIEQFCQVREANHWRIPQEAIGWMNSVSYQNAERNATNAYLYTQLVKKAEELLWPKQNVILGVVWAINVQKQTAQFVVDEKTYGGFNYAKFGLKTLEIGQPLSLVLQLLKQADGSFWVVQDAATSTAPPIEHLVKSFEGILRMTGRIGFVGQVMVAENQIHFAMNTCDTPKVAGKAVRAFDHKHQKWGWKAIYIEKKT